MSLAVVTGASGFIGGRLAQRLAQEGRPVRCVARRSSRLERLRPLKLELAYCDLRTDDPGLRDALAGADVVFHLAGKTSAVRAGELTEVNARGARRVAEACAAQPQPPVLVLVSSLAAAGPAPPGRPRRESDPPAPVSAYGRSKLAGEVAVQRLADRIPVTIVRPGVVFGPHDRETSRIIAPIRYLGIHALPGLWTPRLSLIHVDDLVELLLRAARSGRRIDPSAAQGPGAGIYFAADRQQPTYARLGWMIGRALGRPFTLILPLPSPIAWAAAAAFQNVLRLAGRSTTFNVDKIREARARSWACDPGRAERELGFRPAKPLQARLEETVAWRP